MSAKCIGCDVNSKKTGVYGEDNPVEEDRTYDYETKRFVCDDCYARLVAMNLGKGSSLELRQRAAIFLRPAPKTVERGGQVFNVLTSYSLEQAVLDGILTIIATLGPCPVVINTGLLKERGFDKDSSGLPQFVDEGLKALRVPDKEDGEGPGARRLRVLEKKLWVIGDGQTITFLRPEDY